TVIVDAQIDVSKCLRVHHDHAADVIGLTSPPAASPARSAPIQARRDRHVVGLLRRPSWRAEPWRRGRPLAIAAQSKPSTSAFAARTLRPKKQAVRPAASM